VNAAAAEGAHARLEALRAGAIVVARIDEMVTSFADAEHLEEKRFGHIDGMRERGRELAEALRLSPARAAAAVQRVRRSCQRKVDRVERELADDIDDGPTYDVGLDEADLIVLRMWPAPLGPPPSDCPACGAEIRSGAYRAHTSADVWVCLECYLGRVR
jgi:hypothetical protein